MSRTALSFANASCAHCARLVTRILGSQNGIRWTEVDQGRLQVFVDYDPTVTSVKSIQQLLERSGYPTQLVAADIPTSRPSLSSRAA